MMGKKDKKEEANNEAEGVKVTNCFATSSAPFFVSNSTPYYGWINYKYEEGNLIMEFKQYIDKTYSAHYVGKNNIQSFDCWLARSVEGTEETAINNANKYLMRYGKKNGYNRDDIMKAIHYCFLVLHCHNKLGDRIEKEQKCPPESPT